MALIRARGLSIARRLDAVDLALHAGELVGLIGPNGAGKSSLLHALAGILAYQGEIELAGERVAAMAPGHRARLVALQPQFIDSHWSLCVADIVSFGRIPWNDMNQDIIGRAMRLAGVEPLAARRIDELSGGEKARVWLARMLAHQARLLLLDEPIANLDIHYQHEVLRLLREYAATGHAVLIAMHDLSLAARYCDRLLLLNETRLVASGRVSEVLQPELLGQVFRTDIHVDLASHPPVVLAR